MDRVAVTLIVAAYSMFELGWTVEQVCEWIKSDACVQPTMGYVYADCIPTSTINTNEVTK